MPQSHQVLHHTFSLISQGNPTISLEDLGRFITKNTSMEINYSSLREMMHRSTGDYEISWDEFLRIMTTEESVAEQCTRGRSLSLSEKVVQEKHQHSSLDMRNKIEQRKQTYGVFVNKTRSFAVNRTSPKDSIVPGLSPELSNVFLPHGTFNPLMKRHRSLNHTNNVVENGYSAMEQVFRVFDTERRGELSQDNIKEVMQAVGFPKPTKREMRGLYKMIGKKNSKETLSLEDFTRLFVLCQEDEIQLPKLESVKLSHESKVSQSPQKVVQSSSSKQSHAENRRFNKLLSFDV
eukprot:CAMPEP_0117446856 /NCGR_PEP_ID=MMETSP0759-20121206/6565_1 /TAXON_ID=63605 /ORGANISM="Percolomonas cosmopolitus, Strain WS" /LENGTH=291 /DNA_ID=CAMNT_0005239153 /DNA_START=218 /DNA_END=1089 /DNA_ORIENTATION=-